MIWGHRDAEPLAELSVSEYWDLRERTRAFSGVAAYADGSANLTGGGAPERLRTGYMTAGTTAVLGVRPGLGRGFTEEEDLPGGRAAALLSDGLWRRRFGADAGRSSAVLTLDDAPITVVGVMPPDFQLPSNYSGTPVDVWVPLQLDPATDRGVRGWHFLNVVGRLHPGVTLAAASRETSTLMRGMLAAHPTEYTPEFNGSAMSVSQEVVGDVRPAILVLLAAVALLLLTACANVAGLLLARSEARQREIALRIALGAGQGRLVRQLLTESLLLAAGGGVLGLAAAVWGVRGLVLAAPASVPRLEAVASTAGYSGSLSSSPLSPACCSGWRRRCTRCARASPARWPTAGAAARRAGPDSGFRRALVTGQVALALVLVTGAGLLVQSFVRLRQVDPGFVPRAAADRAAPAVAGEVPEQRRPARVLPRAARAARGDPGRALGRRRRGRYP